MTESQTDVRKWVTAVILMEDDAEGTEECVRSLLRGSCVPGILLIDDSAGRLPEEQLRERYPGITIFRTGFQTGRCHAANCGLHLVRTPYALLLSGSVRAGRSMTQHLLDAAVSEDRCYAAQARIERLEEKGRIESTGVLFSAAGRAVYRDRGMYRKTSRGGEVFAPDMRAVLLNMRAMEDLGLFDERLTGIAAEADLGCRAARVDGRCLFVPKARAGIRTAAAASRRTSFPS
jgi:GT2 family glycosyltransferase